MNVQVIPGDETVTAMTELMRLIQAHVDRYGVTRATVARRAGISPQTVHNWGKQIRALPEARHLRGVPEVIGVPYPVVLDAALTDAGYRDDATDDIAALETRIRAAVNADPALLDAIWFAINRIRTEHALARPARADTDQPPEVDILTSIVRRQLGADDLPAAARTEDYPKRD